MKLKQLGSNQTLVVIDGNNEFFFSYDTCVAGMSRGHYFKTATKWSKTTKRHIDNYLGDVNAVVVSQDAIDMCLFDIKI